MIYFNFAIRIEKANIVIFQENSAERKSFKRKVGILPSSFKFYPFYFRYSNI